MKKYSILLILLLLMSACSKNKNIDFSYSPEYPRTGEKITFTNLSESGDEWEWTWGDNTSPSSSKNPVKTYKRSGTYTVTLQVDGKRYKTVSKEIVVYDSIPSIRHICLEDTDSIVVPVFEPVVFSAMIYNPYSHTLKYTWGSADSSNYVVMQKTSQGQDSIHGSSFKVYFTRPQEMSIYVDITESYAINGRDTVCYHRPTKLFTTGNRTAEALLMQDQAGKLLRQRVFVIENGVDFETISECDTEDASIVSQASDTEQTIDGKSYTLASLPATVRAMNPEGFCMYDSRIYFRTPEGLFVSTVGGEYVRQISSRPVRFVAATPLYARIWWAEEDGVYYMPSIHSAQNAVDATQIRKANSMGNITKLGYNYTPKL